MNKKLATFVLLAVLTLGSASFLQANQDTPVFAAATQTLTNKTLTSPTITGPTFSGTAALATATVSTAISPVSAGGINDGTAALPWSGIFIGARRRITLELQER